MKSIRKNPDLASRHVQSVMNRIKKSYNETAVLAEVQKLGVNSIQEFLLADVNTMSSWVMTSPSILQFTVFKEIYSRYFSNGADKYVDGDYNAYSFIENLDITVCPYCDDEYIDIFEADNHQKRTSEIDHFYPKSKYPALAMCFYNLIPTGQVCNGLKKEYSLGANPYDADIECLTFIYPNLPIGISMEKVDPSECVPQFHAKDGMTANVDVLSLEQRYERHAPEVHRLLDNLQKLPPEKIDELEKMFPLTREQIIISFFGPQNPEEKKNALRQKMLKDLTGY